VATPNEAAALSQAIVVGAALAANIFNMLWQCRHPEKKLIRLEVTLAMAPPCLAGATIGTLLNTVFPPAVIVVMLLLVILFSLHSTLKKGISLWQKESSERKASQAENNQAPAPTMTVVGLPEGGDVIASTDIATEFNELETEATASTEAPEEHDSPHSQAFMYVGPAAEDQPTGLRRRTSTATLEQEAAEEGSAAAGAPASTTSHASAAAPSSSSSKPVFTLLKLLVLWTVLLLAVVLRGGKGASSLVGIEMCSWLYWGVTAAMVLVLLILSFLYKQEEVSILLTFGVGTLSSIVGIGGGLVLNPMLLAAGMDPTSTTATVSVLLLMSCSAASTMLALAGAIPLVPMCVLTLASFLGSLSGKTIIGWIVAKTGRTSTLVFLLAAFMICSSSAIILESGVNIVKEISEGENPFHRFSSPCK